MNDKLPKAHCQNCTLRNESLVPPCGPDDAKIIVIGEGPGATEVDKGQPFAGPAGKVLDYTLRHANVEPAFVWKTNVVMCRPPANRDPSPNEILCCRDRLAAELEAHPRAIVLPLGKMATSTLGLDFKNRGLWQKYQGHDLITSWHPAYILRQPDELNVLINDIRKVARGPEAAIKAPKIIMPRSLEELQAALVRLEADSTNNWVAFDLETDQLRWYDTKSEPKDSILCLALCSRTDYAVIVNDEMLYDTAGVQNELQTFFNAMKAIGHNAKFDVLHLRNIGIEVAPAFDTMLAHYVLDENSKHGLKELAANWLGVPDYEEELVQKYLKSRNDRYSKVPPNELAQYAGWDVAITLSLKVIFTDLLLRNKQYNMPFYGVLMPVSLMATEMERVGIMVDTEYLVRVRSALSGISEAAVDEMKTISGEPDLNIGYPAALSKVMYGKLGFKKPVGKGISSAATSKAALVELPDVPFTRALRRYRAANKMRSAYVENLLENQDENDRVHCTVLVHGTEIGRISMRNPALMTIPREKGNPYGAMIRGAFIAKPGHKLIIIDYSQAELRAMAALSMEPFLIDVYAHDRDLHTEVAKAMFGANYTKEQRVQCKMFNFAYAYGGTEYSFARDAGLPLNVAQKFVADYDKNMPVLKAWKRAQMEQLRAKGYVQTPFGRRRRFPIITQENEDDARKACVHMPVASTAADLTLLSCVELSQGGFEVVLTVHDSIIIEAPDHMANEVGEIALAVMVGMGEKYLPQVKWKADVDIVDRWAEAPEIKFDESAPEL